MKKLDLRIHSWNGIHSHVGDLLYIKWWSTVASPQFLQVDLWLAELQMQKLGVWGMTVCETIWFIFSIHFAFFFQSAVLLFQLTHCFSKAASSQLRLRRHWARYEVHSIQSIRFSLGFPCGSVGKESACNAGDLDLIPGLGRCPGEGNGNPLQYSLPGESYGQRNLAGYCPWGHKSQSVFFVTDMLLSGINILHCCFLFPHWVH